MSSAAAPTPSRRLVLLPVESRPDTLVRRYRMARLRVEPPAATREERLARLRRAHD